MQPRVLYDEMNISERFHACSEFEFMDAVYADGEDFYNSIPYVEFAAPIIAIAEISDGRGNQIPACWELSERLLASCFEPIDAFHNFYIDENRDLHSSGTDLRNGTSFYLFRVFKPEIGRNERQWLIDLINCATELDADIKEKINLYTLPVGVAFTETVFFPDQKQ